ncbi:MAG TPA: condensation domain-containing protein, partial [Thermoanaerobaculia bacterium]|nr:condensation domain-containing protein [Thermoanaerobaculia bacterium]
PHAAAAVLGGTVAEVPGVALPAGAAADVPLTPNQARLFERRYDNPHRLNITQMFEAQLPLHWPRLAAVIGRLSSDHDALRLRFFPDAGKPAGWRQELAAAEPGAGPVPFSLFDLSALPATRQSGAIEQAAEALQGSLHLSRGPLVRLAAFDLGGEAGGRRPSRLLFLGHHLALDHVSLHILADDIGRFYEAAGTGAEPRRAAASTPFQVWAERLRRFADAEELAHEAPYWLGLPWARTVRLPQDFPGGENTGRRARVMPLDLDARDTRALLDELPQALGASVEEILLAAVAWSLAGWTGAPVQLLQRVGHGRISPFADLEISRTLGWFALDYPVVLDISTAADPQQAVAAVAEQVRRVPREGVGYGLLRYLAREPDLAARFRALPAAEVSFNYIGREGQRRARRDTGFQEAAESAGSVMERTARRPSLLNATMMLAGESLRMSWTYSAAVHRAATVERLAAGCSAALSHLLSELVTTGRRRRSG